MRLPFFVLAFLLAACGPSGPPPVDRCDSDMTPCPDGFTDACTPGAPIVGSCCYAAPNGDSNPVGICAADGGA